MKNKLFALPLAILFLVIFISGANAQASFDIETGLVMTGLNHVRIPGNTGTFISFSGELDSDPKAYFRLNAGYRFGKRSEALLLFAPLRFNYTGSLQREVVFQGVSYPANAAINAGYKFNSYRATYRYYVLDRPDLEIGLGLTLKARDALISLESGSLQAERTDFGFVPLINFMIHWQPLQNFGLMLQGDALAAPSGRAEDVLAAITYQARDNLYLKAGYRILEGGADNNSVYTFSLFHYGAVGFVITLR